MALMILEEAIQPVHESLNKKDFSTLIREARDAIGLKLYRAAEFMGVAPSRLKNLETGYFRVMPSEAELHAISLLYDIKESVIRAKAQEYATWRQKTRKVGIYEGMQRVQQD